MCRRLPVGRVSRGSGSNLMRRSRSWTYPHGESASEIVQNHIGTWVPSMIESHCTAGEERGRQEGSRRKSLSEIVKEMVPKVTWDDVAIRFFFWWSHGILSAESASSAAYPRLSRLVGRVLRDKPYPPITLLPWQRVPTRLRRIHRCLHTCPSTPRWRL